MAQDFGVFVICVEISPRAQYENQDVITWKVDSKVEKPSILKVYFCALKDHTSEGV